MNQRKSQQENLKTLQLSENRKSIYQILGDTGKTVLRRKFIANNAYI